jgi:hypothetical protein
MEVYSIYFEFPIYAIEIYKSTLLSALVIADFNIKHSQASYAET